MCLAFKNNYSYGQRLENNLNCVKIIKSWITFSIIIMLFCYTKCIYIYMYKQMKYW